MKLTFTGLDDERVFIYLSFVSLYLVLRCLRFVSEFYKVQIGLGLGEWRWRGEGGKVGSSGFCIGCCVFVFVKYDLYEVFLLW